jgi:sec-independent protein translocase protein TatC
VPLLVSSIVLFYVGVAFAYYVVFPLIFAFLIGTAPDGVAVMTDIAKYLDFVLALFFAFGMAFEIPVATVLVVVAGFVTPEQLAGKRPYVIVGAFVIGAFLTPPDVFSQTLLAVPMWLLFEVGIYFSRLVLSQPKVTGQSSPSPAPANPGPQVAALAAPAPAPGTQAGPTSPGPTSPGSRPWSPPGEGLGEQLAGPVVVGAEIDGGDMSTPGRFVPLTPEQMDAELDAIEGAEGRLARAQAQPAGPQPDEDDGPDSEDLEYSDHPDALPGDRSDAGEVKLRRVQALRDAGDVAAARSLLYEVLEEGDADQRMVARDILTQLDAP